MKGIKQLLALVLATALLVGTMSVAFANRNGIMSMSLPLPKAGGTTSIDVTPNTATIKRTENLTFAAGVSGVTVTDISWGVDSTLSSITEAGNLEVGEYETKSELTVTATGISSLSDAIAGRATVTVPDPFVAVTDFGNVYSGPLVVDVAQQLNFTVLPDGSDGKAAATKKTIDFKISSGETETGATLSRNDKNIYLLTCTKPGKVTVTATVVNGRGKGDNFSKDYEFTVSPKAAATYTVKYAVNNGALTDIQAGETIIMDKRSDSIKLQVTASEDFTAATFNVPSRMTATKAEINGKVATTTIAVVPGNTDAINSVGINFVGTVASGELKNDSIVRLTAPSASVADEVKSIAIATKPYLTTFAQGEGYRMDGGELALTMGDGTVKKLSLRDKAIKITGYNADKLGKQTLTIAYADKTTTLDVTVVEGSAARIMYIKYGINGPATISARPGQLITVNNTTDKVTITVERLVGDEYMLYSGSETAGHGVQMTEPTFSADKKVATFEVTGIPATGMGSIDFMGLFFDDTIRSGYTNILRFEVARSTGGDDTGSGTGGNTGGSNTANDPSTSNKITETVDSIKNLGNVALTNPDAKLPTGVVVDKTAAGTAIATIPVGLTTGSANINLDTFNSLGKAPANVGFKFTVSESSKESVEIIVPGGFGAITEPGRLSYPMDYKSKADDADKMVAMVKGTGTTTTTAQIGGNFALPVAATVTVKSTAPEGSLVNIYKFNPFTGKMIVIGSAKVVKGQLTFATKQMGQMLFTTGKI